MCGHTARFPCNLSVLGKLLERLVAWQLKAHLDSSGLFPRLQFAYRANHSTETVVLKMLRCPTSCSALKVLLVLLVLSAAFETVNHDILLRRLDITYRHNGPVLNWLKSYIVARRQQVHSFSVRWTMVMPHCLSSLAT